MKRIFKIYFYFLAQSFKKEMAYRANFFASLFSDIVHTMVTVIFFKIIFSGNNLISGWNFNQVIILIGIMGLMREIGYLTFREGFSELSYLIRSGKMDNYLTKPFNAQLLTAFHDIGINESIGEGIVGIGLIIYGISQLAVFPNLINIIWCIILLLVSFALYYSFTLLISSIAFWVVQSSGITNMTYILMDSAKFPRDILRGIYKIFFTFIIPSSIIIFVPVHALLKFPDVNQIIILIFVCLFFVISSNIAWNKGLRRYESASS